MHAAVHCLVAHSHPFLALAPSVHSFHFDKCHSQFGSCNFRYHAIGRCGYGLVFGVQERLEARAGEFAAERAKLAEGEVIRMEVRTDVT